MAWLKIQTVAIALAAYRPEPSELLAQLASIQAQTWTNWICVLSFDSDATALKADPDFLPFRRDSRFIWRERAEPLGVIGNFESAIAEAVATGAQALACCDQDDIWYPEKLEISVRELEKLGPGGLVFCDMNLMSAEGKVSTETAFQAERRGVDHCRPFDLIVRNVVPGTGMCLDADLARRFPRIPPAARYHDHWYPLVAASLGRIHAIRRPLYAYRLHSRNLAGLSRYTGLFSRKEGSRIGAKGLSKCRETWRSSAALAGAMEEVGLPLSSFAQAAFRAHWDRGLCLALYGFWRLPSDPALARACWARAVGKAFSRASPRTLDSSASAG